jgi:hypothetical protein
LVNAGVASPTWSADGREIFYADLSAEGAFRFTLSAVNVSSGTVRTLAGTNGTPTGGEVVVAPPTGGYVFFAVGAAIGPQYVIYRVPAAGGTLDTVATDARWPWFQLSRDGRRLAYHKGDGRFSSSPSDSLRVVDATSAFGRTVGGMPTTASVLSMASFSPDGASVVYLDSRVMLFDVASGTSTVLHSAPTALPANARESVSGSVWWDGVRPHLVVATWIDKQGPTSIYDLDGSTGVRTLVGTVPDAVRTPFSMTSSPDGSKVAVWTATKSFNCSVEGCSYDGRLYLLTKGTAGTKIIYDTFGAAASPRWTAFAPDGRSVGTVNWYDLRVVPL